MTDEDLKQLHSLLNRYADQANAEAFGSRVTGERGQAARLYAALSDAAIATAGFRLYKAALPKAKDRPARP